MTAHPCRYCGTSVRPSGSAWLDGDGWELCTDPDREFHEPADGSTTPPERVVSVTEVATATTRLIREAEHGLVITITRQGRPVARLIPFGLAVDEHAEVEELVADVEIRLADLRDHIRRHATPAPPEPCHLHTTEETQ
jgi:prevent-host-death family protein